VNRHVNAIAGRLSLRMPQRESLEILDRITEIAPPRKDLDLPAGDYVLIPHDAIAVNMSMAGLAAEYTVKP
jgi:hypothetical protein